MNFFLIFVQFGKYYKFFLKLVVLIFLSLSCNKYFKSPKSQEYKNGCILVQANIIREGFVEILVINNSPKEITIVEPYLFGYEIFGDCEIGVKIFYRLRREVDQYSQLNIMLDPETAFLQLRSQDSLRTAFEIKYLYSERALAEYKKLWVVLYPHFENSCQDSIMIPLRW